MIRIYMFLRLKHVPSQVVPKSKMRLGGEQAFSVAAPKLRNDLYLILRRSPCQDLCSLLVNRTFLGFIIKIFP